MLAPEMLLYSVCCRTDRQDELAFISYLQQQSPAESLLSLLNSRENDRKLDQVLVSV